jgi:hypothetical protein
MSKKLTFDDLQPHVDMLCDALENKGASSSGLAYDEEIYVYAKKYREILQRVREKQIGITCLWIDLRHLEMDILQVAKTQRHRIAKIVNALNLYIKKEYSKVNHE